MSDFPSEREEQEAICDWMEERNIVFFAPTNETNVRVTRYGFAGRRINQKIGARVGVPDLIIVTPAKNGKPTGLEMKTANGTLADMAEKQLEWKEKMLACGWNHVVGFGADDAERQLICLGYAEPPTEEQAEEKRIKDLVVNARLTAAQKRLLFEIHDNSGKLEVHDIGRMQSAQGLFRRDLAEIDFDCRPRLAWLTPMGCDLVEHLK